MLLATPAGSIRISAGDGAYTYWVYAWSWVSRVDPVENRLWRKHVACRDVWAVQIRLDSHHVLIFLESNPHPAAATRGRYRSKG